MICKKCKKEIPDGSIFCCICGVRQVSAEKKSARRARPNGTGSAYKRGKTWTAVAIVGWKTIDLGNGKKKRLPVKRTKGGFPSKTDALNYTLTLRGGKSKKEKVTLDALYQPWSTSAMLKLSKSKQTAYKIAYEKWRQLAYTEISQLTIGALQEQLDEKAATFYPARDMKSVLSHLYKRAIAQGDVASNLAEFLVLPKLEEGEKNPFTDDELKALWKDYADGQTFTGYILLMSYSGMMPGELFIAEKGMIDWEKQTITGCGLKTKKRKETPLVVADIILPVLHDLCEHSKSKMLLDLNRDYFYERFHETMRRCACRTGHTPYDCRHSTATALALADIPPSVIQKVMRHAKFATTQRYIHVDAAPMLEAVNKIAKEGDSHT
ncbi:tyrosine-type recombinase/integrase [Anaerotruncus massiliensis (ex Liu et al. 2021)]|uniref:tyrosine-type recombinase/integrase n=1 Tax=Anaerotruncus massiliensis (ex Liu et al. 2021) TaxID=2321404 RepID=UPI003AB6B3EF